MSEQAKIMQDIHTIVMSILKTGTATIEEADEIDRLEALLDEQKCFKEIDDINHTSQGEEIAGLFFRDDYEKAINKMLECEISPEDFFGFVEYYYDDDHEDEELTEMFTGAFRRGVNEAYQARLNS